MIAGITRLQRCARGGIDTQTVVLVSKEEGARIYLKSANGSRKMIGARVCFGTETVVLVSTTKEIASGSLKTSACGSKIKGAFTIHHVCIHRNNDKRCICFGAIP